jgi:hypothetical protein
LSQQLAAPLALLFQQHAELPLGNEPQVDHDLTDTPKSHSLSASTA